jgi:hypothetical protein
MEVALARKEAQDAFGDRRVRNQAGQARVIVFTGGERRPPPFGSWRATSAERLNLSLALQARRDANVWQSAARDWTMNADQVEACREYAADYRRTARDHLADARLAKAARLTSRYHGRIAA